MIIIKKINLGLNQFCSEYLCKIYYNLEGLFRVNCIDTFNIIFKHALCFKL